MGKGKLITVQLGPKHFVKMYEADAIEKGLVSGPPKARPPAANKMLPAQGNKAAPDMSGDMTPNGQPNPQLDDFTTIDGVGLGIARSLAARGITSFAQLRASTDLSFLSKKAQAAIETWRNA